MPVSRIALGALTLFCCLLVSATFVLADDASDVKQRTVAQITMASAITDDLESMNKLLPDALTNQLNQTNPTYMVSSSDFPTVELSLSTENGSDSKVVFAYFKAPSYKYSASDLVAAAKLVNSSAPGSFGKVGGPVLEIFAVDQDFVPPSDSATGASDVGMIVSGVVLTVASLGCVTATVWKMSSKTLKDY